MALLAAGRNAFSTWISVQSFITLVLGKHLNDCGQFALTISFDGHFISGLKHFAKKLIQDVKILQT